MNGQMVTAPKLSNNGNQFFTQGANGTQQTGDFGMTYDEGITSQNNLATQGLRGQEINEDIRSNQANEALTGFSNQTGRMNAVTAWGKAQSEALAGPKRSLNPIYGQDAEGNFTVGQLTSDGQLIPAAAPEGFNPISPYDKNYQSTAGKYAAQTQGELDAGRTKATSAFRSMVGKTNDMSDTVNRAIEQTNWSNTGPLGRLNPLATDLQGTIETIQADTAFGALQEMRDNSKTGGALGQVSERELDLLKAARVAVTRSQSEGQLDSNLKKYNEIRARALENARQAHMQDYGVDPMEGVSGGDGLSEAEMRELEELERAFGGN